MCQLFEVRRLKGNVLCALHRMCAFDFPICIFACRTVSNAQSSILPAVQVSLPSATAFIAMCKVIGDRPHHKNLHDWICCKTKMEDKKYTREYSPESNKKGSSQHFTVQACLKWRCRTRPACFLVPGLQRLLRKSCKNFRSIHFFKCQP